MFFEWFQVIKESTIQKIGKDKKKGNDPPAACYEIEENSRHGRVNNLFGCCFASIVMDRSEREFVMKQKIEVNKPEDIEKLEQEERSKWEIALELGLFDKVVEQGWKSLTARESGKIGGILSSKKRKMQEGS